jgi:hypothetical protein
MLPVSLPKSGPYTIEFNAEGYIPYKTTVKKSFNYFFLLNFLTIGIGGSTFFLSGGNLENLEEASDLAGIGFMIGASGLIGTLIDIFTGSLITIKQPQITVELKMTPEKVAARQAEEARKKAEAEARQKAIDEANKYDASKFTIVPDNFKPADYTKADLFKAATASKNLQIASDKAGAALSQAFSAVMGGLGGSYMLSYVSELTFVWQNGIDIAFASDDNAISQYMTINQRSGLQSGEKVKVYYLISRAPLITWTVVAIERR